MQKKKVTNGWYWFFGILALIALALSTRAANPIDYAVQVSANVSTSPAQISLVWPSSGFSTGYTVSRKAVTSSSWTQVATLPANATSWTDSNVSVGASYEYAIIMSGNGGFNATGYVYAGINKPMVEARGKVLLVVDNTYANQLSTELTRMQQDLAGDGWTVVRKDVSRTDSVGSVKNAIKAEYNNGGLRSVLLFGHVPVPYSGDFNPDGHPDHVGAYPTDTYYADMDGNWTDSNVNDTSASKAWNHNVPGDGKFDQSYLPSDVELEIGRVDLANMTCFSNKSPSRSELDLLRQYLNKDHNFRHGLLNVQRRGFICDYWGIPYGEAFSAMAFRASSAMFGQGQTYAPATSTADYFGTLNNNSYLFSWGGGGGDLYSCAGVSTSDQMAVNDPKSVFTLYLGSYFDDWDNESAFLRTPLGTTSYTLTSGWAGRPQWQMHHMALGETIGYATKVTQNNSSTYSPQYIGTRGVHITLHGDPTLRLHTVLPASNLQGVTAGSTVTLTWSPSNDSAIQGYHVFRASSVNGPFTRVTENPLVALTYTDASAPSGSVYMVRALKLETSGSGTYYNLSQGLFYGAGTTTGGGGTPTAPIAPSNLIATSSGSSQISLAWSDNSGDETGFKIERKVGAAGTYASLSTTAANAHSFADTGLNAGTTYFYRVSAINALGASATVEANASTAAATGVSATASFIGSDSVTQGSWKGVYGADGQSVIGDTSILPGYAQVAPAGHTSWTWIYNTSDTRALQRIGGTDRIASTWFADASFTVDVNLTDGQTHRTSLYFLDWDQSSRSQTVEVLDASSGAVLSSQTVSGFGSGRYLTWDLKGAIRFRFTKLSGFNAVLSGLFFAPATANSGGMQKTTTVNLARATVSVQISGSVGQVFKIYSTSDLNAWAEVTTVTLTAPTYNYMAPAGSGGQFYKAVPQ